MRLRSRAGRWSSVPTALAIASEVMRYCCLM